MRKLHNHDIWLLYNTLSNLKTIHMRLHFCTYSWPLHSMALYCTVLHRLSDYWYSMVQSWPLSEPLMWDTPFPWLPRSHLIHRSPGFLYSGSFSIRRFPWFPHLGGTCRLMLTIDTCVFVTIRQFVLPGRVVQDSSCLIKAPKEVDFSAIWCHVRNTYVLVNFCNKNFFRFGFIKKGMFGCCYKT